MGGPRIVFNILFILKSTKYSSEHPLGPDFVNITKPNKVTFYGIFD